MDDRLLEPAKAYREYYAEEFNINANEYFNDLVKKSGIDAEQNRQTVKEYEAAATKSRRSQSALGNKKGWRGFHIFLCVLFFCAALIGIYLLVIGLYIAGGVTLPVGLGMGIGQIFVILCFNKKVKSLKEELEKHQEQEKEILQRAWGEMSALNALFDGTATKKLVQKTVPLIQLDDDFNMRRYDYLSGKYGFGENLDEDASTIAVVTGEILGNPFVVDREIYKYMGTQTYYGSIIIHWTTTYRDSQGRVQTQHHSQTLTASVTKPKPYFSERTRLIYGNEAAPDLTFTHTPSHAERLNEKQLQHKVASGQKQIQKLQKKQLQNNENNFTEMGNAEFDVLFGATDRNNEVQFRLLFTPLAQKNMLDLMKDKTGFGDDFSFVKAGCLNYISSEHSAIWQPDIDYKSYRSYSVDLAQKSFVGQNSSYFKCLFFDLAPLLSIPLYQQHKPHEYIYRDSYERNYTSYEAEYAVNRMGRANFAHELSATDSILKTNLLGTEGDSDRVHVVARSYRIEQHTELIPRLGGDGRMHTVPVVWDEYIPVEAERIVSMKRLNMTDRDFDNRIYNEEDSLKKALQNFGGKSVFAHGILCCLLNCGDTAFDGEINRVLNSKVEDSGTSSVSSIANDNE